MEDLLPKTYLNDLVMKYDHFLLDWDGVIYSGGAAIEGSIEAIKYIRKHGKSLYFITNSSGRSQKGLKEKLAKLGIDIEVKEALPSGLTTAIYIKDTYPDIKKVYVVGERGLMDQLELEGLKCIGGADETEVSMTPEEYEDYKLDEEVGAVVVGYDMNLHYRKSWIATLYIQNGAKFIAWNDDMFDMVQGRPIPTTGVALKCLEYATGLKPYVWGKPNPHIFELLCKSFGMLFILNYYIGIKDEDKKKWIMFGDRIDTDIKFGKNSGIDTTFVLTGCHTVDDMNNPEINSSFEIRPTYVMPRLGNFKEENDIKVVDKFSHASKI